MKKRKNIRSDYMAERNKEIYEKFVSGKSLNTLGDEYGLSPQRISKIVDYFTQTNLSKRLKTTDTKEKREYYCNKAISIREQGSLKVSILMFDDVIRWDKENHNTVGLIHALGNKKIAVQKLAEFSSSRQGRQKLLKEASAISKESLYASKKANNKGLIAISSVHYASSLLAVSLSKKTRNEEELKEALKVLNPVLKDFPGSKAHKAWPLKLKAEILIELEKPMEAFLILNEAEVYILNGNREELKESDGNLKLKVWLTGIWLAKARACIKLKYNLLARMYAQSVLGVRDSTKTLSLRKREAKNLVARYSL